jgi:MFS family permease
LSAHLGRRNYFLASIAIFTLSSFLCGIAGSLGQLILFRVIQGLFHHLPSAGLPAHLCENSGRFPIF